MFEAKKNSDDFEFDICNELSVYEYLNDIEVIQVNRNNYSPITVRKIDKYHYELYDASTNTSEIKEYDLTAINRSDNISNVLRTLRNLKRVIKMNFNGFQNELWLTLTYRENVRDTKRVYEDFKRFIQRLRRKLKINLDYVNVLEPQERGAWHCHVLLKTDEDINLYIDNKIVECCWGQGYTKTKKCNSSDNVAAYLTAYLTDVKDDKTGNIKKFARLHFYPKNMKFFRCSKGIKKPENLKKKMTFDELEEFLSDTCLTYNVEMFYNNDKENVINIKKAFFRKRGFENESSKN